MKPLVIEARCACPCHSPLGDLAITHIAPCCCPHRYVVPADCPDCINMQESA